MVGPSIVPEHGGSHQSHPLIGFRKRLEAFQRRLDTDDANVSEGENNAVRVRLVLDKLGIEWRGSGRGIVRAGLRKEDIQVQQPEEREEEEADLLAIPHTSSRASTGSQNASPQAASMESQMPVYVPLPRTPRKSQSRRPAITESAVIASTEEVRGLYDVGPPDDADFRPIQLIWPRPDFHPHLVARPAWLVRQEARARKVDKNRDRRTHEVVAAPAQEVNAPRQPQTPIGTIRAVIQLPQPRIPVHEPCSEVLLPPEAGSGALSPTQSVSQQIAAASVIRQASSPTSIKGAGDTTEVGSAPDCTVLASESQRAVSAGPETMSNLREARHAPAVEAAQIVDTPGHRLPLLRRRVLAIETPTANRVWSSTGDTYKSTELASVTRPAADEDIVMQELDKVNSHAHSITPSEDRTQTQTQEESASGTEDEEDVRRPMVARRQMQKSTSSHDPRTPGVPHPPVGLSRRVHSTSSSTSASHTDLASALASEATSDRKRKASVMQERMQRLQAQEKRARAKQRQLKEEHVARQKRHDGDSGGKDNTEGKAVVLRERPTLAFQNEQAVATTKAKATTPSVGPNVEIPSKALAPPASSTPPAPRRRRALPKRKPNFPTLQSCLETWQLYKDQSRLSHPSTPRPSAIFDKTTLLLLCTRDLWRSWMGDVVERLILRGASVMGAEEWVAADEEGRKRITHVVLLGVGDRLPKLEDVCGQLGVKDLSEVLVRESDDQRGPNERSRNKHANVKGGGKKRERQLVDHHWVEQCIFLDRLVDDEV